MAEITPQLRRVDLPVAVFGPVQQHHRQQVAVLCAQAVVALGGERVDVGGHQREPELVTKHRELLGRAGAQMASGPCQQRHGVPCGGSWLRALHPASIPLGLLRVRNR
ncbi:hypothetical protein MSMEG_0950 [Mycolicibacterium smegmatis MC2 155]|uniref:Uncharacterized protein n=1 Tax=Mycolicibacterium smegmatis (strain ATCC 700084 / mc(2)155) TaxID=246196 RepID=A0QR15_MYCS2|nr:hypothetical protein MSMEG_0950 [Mycolicibacterium smegmatis MC2 155]